MSESRSDFEEYWRERQLRTHRYTDRPCPDDWGRAFKADAEAAWQASRRAALEEAIGTLDEFEPSMADEGVSYYLRQIEMAIRSLAQTKALEG